MLHSAPLALSLFAASFALQGAAAPITTTLLLPDLGPSATYPAFDAFSEAGVGTDGRTTYVATATLSGKVEMVTYALGPNDYVEDVVAVVKGSITRSGSEACTFAGGATAGAVGACTAVIPEPVRATTRTIPRTRQLVATGVPVLLKTNDAAPASSAGCWMSAVIGITALSFIDIV